MEPSDYRFLQRFLDVTKANLFFARGVMIVEGDAESILIPTLAKLINHDFTEHGVSIVNVGGIGLRRYAKIFQRKGTSSRELEVPVACVTDMDVMPNCGPEIIGKVKPGELWPEKKNRRWRAEKDFEGDNDTETLAERKKHIEEKAHGQCVKSFVADKWTLEYDLAYEGLAEEVYTAAYLAKKEEVISDENLEDEINNGKSEYQKLIEEVNEGELNGCTKQEYIASKVYAMFTKGKKASKPITAQYLAELLDEAIKKGELNCNSLRDKLPKYLVNAIDYVTPISHTEKQVQHETGK